MGGQAVVEDGRFNSYTVALRQAGNLQCRGSLGDSSLHVSVAVGSEDEFAAAVERLKPSPIEARVGDAAYLNCSVWEAGAMCDSSVGQPGYWIDLHFTSRNPSQAERRFVELTRELSLALEAAGAPASEWHAPSDSFKGGLSCERYDPQGLVPKALTSPGLMGPEHEGSGDWGSAAAFALEGSGWVDCSWRQWAYPVPDGEVAAFSFSFTPGSEWAWEQGTSEDDIVVSVPAADAASAACPDHGCRLNVLARSTWIEFYTEGTTVDDLERIVDAAAALIASLK